MNILNVKITQKFLDNDNSYISSRDSTCPLAQAIVDMGFSNVHINKQMTRFCKKNRIFVSKNTSQLKRWLRELDNGTKKKPTIISINYIELT